MEYYGGDMQVTINGVTHHISEGIIKELFRQISIQNGKNILENYTESIAVDFDTITEDQFVKYINEVENEMLCDTGDIEWRVMERIFGVKEGW